MILKPLGHWTLTNLPSSSRSALRAINLMELEYACCWLIRRRIAMEIKEMNPRTAFPKLNWVFHFFNEVGCFGISGTSLDFTLRNFTHLNCPSLCYNLMIIITDTFLHFSLNKLHPFVVVVTCFQNIKWNKVATKVKTFKYRQQFFFRKFSSFNQPTLI